MAVEAPAKPAMAIAAAETTATRPFSTLFILFSFSLLVISSLMLSFQPFWRGRS
jgi:hypothetical protein